MAESHVAFYNIYQLYNDHSPEAEAFLQEWSDSWPGGRGKTPREKLDYLITGLQAEDTVLAYLRDKYPNDGWWYADPNRLFISPIRIGTHDQPDLKNLYTSQTIEVKIVNDEQMTGFGDWAIAFPAWRKFHNANRVICINQSQTQLCELDLTSGYTKGTCQYFKPLKSVSLND